MNALELSSVSRDFTTPDGGVYRALDEISLSIPAGSFVAIVGPSGCGKSTLLNIVAGLLAPSAGTVRVDGVPLAGLNQRATYMFQQDALLPWKTVRENVALGLTLAHIAKADAHARADAEQQRLRIGVVGDVGIVRREDRQPPFVVAGVDDQVHRLLDPLRGFFGAEVVEDQQIGGHHRPQDLELGGPDRRIVGTADDAQQIAGVVEEAARPRLVHHLLEDGDGEVRLADARRPFEQQPAPLLAQVVGRREPIGHAARLLQRALERRVVGGEILQRAMEITFGNVGGAETIVAGVLAPALAADHPADAVDIDGVTTGVVALRAGHPGILSGRARENYF